MRIVNLEVQDFMRVEAVEITPSDDVVTIGGKNGAGKSSVLNAIVATLGGAKLIPGVPVRGGEKQAVTRLTLSRPEGDLEVTRTIKADGKTKLTVTSADGAAYGKPQQLLDGLVGAIGFDPHGFTRFDQRKQAEQLRALVGLDFSNIDEDRQKIYSNRTEVNREAKSLYARLDAMPSHDDAPDSEVSVAELMKELSDAEALQREYENGEHAVESLKKGIQATKIEINGLETKLAKACESLDIQKNHLEVVEDCTEKKRIKSEKFDVSGIRNRIQRADTDNRKARDNAERQKVAEDLAYTIDEIEKLTRLMHGLDEEKSMAMGAADWPVEGLGFDESGGVTFHNRPFAQASSAEQLRVSLAMGMACNPQLRVLIIRDGSLIDDDTMAVIRQSVADNEFQVWIERLSGDGNGCTLVIEEGRVAEVA